MINRVSIFSFKHFTSGLVFCQQPNILLDSSLWRKCLNWKSSHLIPVSLFLFVKNGAAGEYLLSVLIPTKLPLCAADFPLFPSPQSCLICLFICLWWCCFLVIFPGNGSTLCLNVTWFKYLPCSTLLKTEGGLIRVSRSFAAALTSLVITSSLIMVRSLFPLIWIIRIILVKGLWCRVFSKLLLAHCLRGIFNGDKFEVQLQQVRVWLVNGGGAQCSRLQSNHGACQWRITVWQYWAVNLKRHSKTGGFALFLSYSAVLDLMGVNKQVNEAGGENTQRCYMVGDDALKLA